MYAPNPTCILCNGSGKVPETMTRGFFTYQAGASCPDCEYWNQRQIAKQAGQTIVMPSAAGGDIETRLKRLEDAVFGKEK